MTLRTIKQIIAAVLVSMILGIAYYGSYLPLRKSQAFIVALRSPGPVATFDDFKKVFSVPLDAPSPIGQEELVRNFANNIVNVVNQQGTNPKLTEEAIQHLDSYFTPILERGRGLSFAQNLYILGALNELALFKTRDVKNGQIQLRYLVAAKNYFSQGFALGPKRPQFLYGMFDVTRAEYDILRAQGQKQEAEAKKQEAVKIGKQILNQWPTDEKTQKALTEFLNHTLTK